MELRAGDVLYLPAWWWHEVVTEEVGPDGLNVSVNFWFDIHHRVLQPTRPFCDGMRVEAARQLEVLVAHELRDCGGALHVTPFLTALHAQLLAIHNGECDVAADALYTEAMRDIDTDAVPTGASACSSSHEDDRATHRTCWCALHDYRPMQVSVSRWEALFEFVAWKLMLLVGDQTLNHTESSDGHAALYWVSQLRDLP